MQVYRTHFIEAGVITASDWDEVEFVIPYLDEYLRGLATN